MEKVIAVLRRADPDDDWCDHQRGPVADALLDLGVAGLSVNVRDSAVRHSLMTHHDARSAGRRGGEPMDPAMLWRPNGVGAETACRGMRTTRRVPCHRIDPTERTRCRTRSRTPGLANIALLRRPADLDQATWLTRWQGDHTSVAIETQSIFGYTQNWVVRTLTPDAPGIAGIVEELFPTEAITDLKAFFGAADDDDLQDRLGQMVASTAAFGANENIDTVPTSRYVFRTPFENR